jgi:hypothetical protein
MNTNAIKRFSITCLFDSNTTIGINTHGLCITTYFETLDKIYVLKNDRIVQNIVNTYHDNKRQISKIQEFNVYIYPLETLIFSIKYRGGNSYVQHFDFNTGNIQ